MRRAELSAEAELESGTVVALALVRAALVPVVVALLVVASLSAGAAAGTVWVVSPVIAAAVAWRPWGALPALVGALAGVIVLIGGRPPVGVVMALVLLVHLTLWTAAFAARGSWNAWVEVRVLTRAARGFLGVQLGAQALAILAVTVSGASLGTGDVWRAAAVLAALGVALIALPNLPADR
ncbi:hypothetical protein [Cellulomonas edaphi]|uniref:MFS transporter n=1 Tax=Cellulomonas edaphi TaxID=3053468 RepID=A0ABT7S314_9CELL|nr:hypothetical protein [Cellulomons edaphi]MDM7830011.1 hypothetical protein [Cellulomons edaphi]